MAVEFLVAVVGVLLLRNQGAFPAIQRDAWFADWAARLGGQQWLAGIPYGRLLVAVLLPVIAVYLVAGLFGGGAFSLWLFLIELLVLLYSLGRGNLDGLVRAYEQDLGREDLQAAFHDAAIFNPNQQEGKAEDWDQLHEETLVAIPYCYFERYFPVLFWFILLGAPGALFYRLTQLYRQSPLAEGQEAANADDCLKLLEWLPLRLLGLVFAFVGNFSTTMGCWRESIFSAGVSSREVLRDYLNGALNLSAPMEDIFEGDFSDLGLEPSDQPLNPQQREISAIRALFERALILWLSLAALWAILF